MLGDAIGRSPGTNAPQLREQVPPRCVISWHCSGTLPPFPERDDLPQGIELRDEEIEFRVVVEFVGCQFLLASEFQPVDARYRADEVLNRAGDLKDEEALRRQGIRVGAQLERGVRPAQVSSAGAEKLDHAHAAVRLGQTSAPGFPRRPTAACPCLLARSGVGEASPDRVASASSGATLGGPEIELLTEDIPQRAVAEGENVLAPDGLAEFKGFREADVPKAGGKFTRFDAGRLGPRFELTIEKHRKRLGRRLRKGKTQLKSPPDSTVQ